MQQNPTSLVNATNAQKMELDWEDLQKMAKKLKLKYACDLPEYTPDFILDDSRV